MESFPHSKKYPKVRAVDCMALHFHRSVPGVQVSTLMRHMMPTGMCYRAQKYTPRRSGQRCVVPAVQLSWG